MLWCWLEDCSMHMRQSHEMIKVMWQMWHAVADCYKHGNQKGCKLLSKYAARPWGANLHLMQPWLSHVVSVKVIIYRDQFISDSESGTVAVTVLRNARHKHTLQANTHLLALVKIQIILIVNFLKINDQLIVNFS